MADHKLDIFKALSAVDRRDGGWLERQTEDERKGFAPPVFMRWASALSQDGIEAEYTLMMVNERLNVGSEVMMTLYPDLMFRLAASCGLGRTVRHEWVPMAPRRGNANKATEIIALFHPLANDTELELLLSKYTREEFKDLAEHAGLADVQIKEAVKTYDKLFGKTGKTEGKSKKSRA